MGWDSAEASSHVDLETMGRSSNFTLNAMGSHG